MKHDAGRDPDRETGGQDQRAVIRGDRNHAGEGVTDLDTLMAMQGGLETGVINRLDRENGLRPGGKVRHHRAGLGDLVAVVAVRPARGKQIAGKSGTVFQAD